MDPSENRFLRCVLEERQERQERQELQERREKSQRQQGRQGFQQSKRMQNPVPKPAPSYEQEFPTLGSGSGVKASCGGTIWAEIAKIPAASSADPLGELPAKPVNPLYVLPPEMIAYRKKEEEFANAMKPRVFSQTPARLDPRHGSEIVYDADGFPYYQS